jgi:RNA polymerase sigma factor (sigma-70 family)
MDDHDDDNFPQEIGALERIVHGRLGGRLLHSGRRSPIDGGDSPDRADSPENEDPPVDNELVARARAGDESALDAVAARCRTVTYAAAFCILRNRADAEDVAQQVTAKVVCSNFAAFDPEHGEFSTWLKTAARHRAIDILRYRKPRRPDRSAPDLDTLPDPAMRPDEQAEVTERRAVLQVLWQRLPERLREVSRLYHVMGLTQQEVADITGLPLGTVGSRAYEAFHKLVALGAPYRKSAATAGPGRPRLVRPTAKPSHAARRRHTQKGPAGRRPKPCRRRRR